MKRKAVTSFLFLSGALLFLYPLVANWYHKRVQYEVISSHEQYINMLDYEKIEEIQQYLEEYNAFLSGTANQIDVEMIYKEILPEGEVIGKIVLSRIDETFPILVGISDEVLEKGVGYMKNTSAPIGGKSVHTVLTGHRGLLTTTMFKNLNKMRVGDTFEVTVYGKQTLYKIDQIKIVERDEIEEIKIVQGKDYTTLITCHPYGSNAKRLLVRGVRIYDDGEIQNADPISIFEKHGEYVLGTVSFLVMAVVIVLYRKKKKK